MRRAEPEQVVNRIEPAWSELPRWRERLALALMLAPYVVGLVGLVAIPSALALGAAFAEYDALTRPRWIGFGNFARMANDRLYWIALGNTLIYLALAVPLRIGAAFLLALLFKRGHSGASLARTAVYLPSVIPSVAYALIWLVSFNPAYGPVNTLLGALGLPTPGWRVEAWPALWSLVILAVWQLGECFVILLAAARGVPESLYEASAMDGAGAWAGFRHVTLPLLLPGVLLLTARDLIVTMQASFVPSLVVTEGGPGYATLFIPLYTYRLAFDDLRFGYAAAVVWTIYLLLVVVVAGLHLLSRRGHPDGGLLG
jgi:multiple sugar transport system permease protein